MNSDWPIDDVLFSVLLRINYPQQCRAVSQHWSLLPVRLSVCRLLSRMSLRILPQPPKSSCPRATATHEGSHRAMESSFRTISRFYSVNERFSSPMSRCGRNFWPRSPFSLWLAFLNRTTKLACRDPYPTPYPSIKMYSHHSSHKLYRDQYKETFFFSLFHCFLSKKWLSL